MRSVVFVVARETGAGEAGASNPGMLTSLGFWIGCDLIEAKNTHKNHSHNWSREEKGLPAGLKGDTLHADPLV